MKKQLSRTFALVVLVSAWLLTANKLFPAAAIPFQSDWPTHTWRTSTPEEQGIDSAQLVKMADVIQARGLDIHSILIVRHGYLVTEAYFSPFQASSIHSLASCAKSLVSALTGIAIEKGYIDSVNHKMLDYFSDRPIKNGAGKQAITLEHMLTMSAGLAWDEWRPVDPQNTFFKLTQSQDWMQFALDRPVAQQPGTQWNYNTSLPNLLTSIIEKTSQMTILDFAKRFLFAPLGITDYEVVVEAGGTLNVALTPREMAKLGYLYLNKGVWDGNPVIPAGWVKTSTANHIHTPHGQNYGYFWWLPSFGGFAAEGDGAQLIFVLPDLDMVVVMTAGLTYPDMATVPDELMTDFILPAVKTSEALPANPQAVSRLNAWLQAIQQSQTRPALALPEMAHTISAKTYVLRPNSIGLEAFMLDFAAPEPTIKLWFSGRAVQLGIGLDNTYRITPLPRIGPLYGWMALRGRWLGSDFFSLHLMMSGLVRDLEFRFGAGDVTVLLRGSRGEQERIPGTLQK